MNGFYFKSYGYIVCVTRTINLCVCPLCGLVFNLYQFSHTCTASTVHNMFIYGAFCIHVHFQVAHKLAWIYLEVRYSKNCRLRKLHLEQLDLWQIVDLCIQSCMLFVYKYNGAIYLCVVVPGRVRHTCCTLVDTALHLLSHTHFSDTHTCRSQQLLKLHFGHISLSKLMKNVVWNRI